MSLLDTLTKKMIAGGIALALLITGAVILYSYRIEIIVGLCVAGTIAALVVISKHRADEAAAKRAERLEVVKSVIGKVS